MITRRKNRDFIVSLFLLGVAGTLPDPAVSAEVLGPPVDCQPGIDCFLQFRPDLDPGPDVVDPQCGSASYDGHTGTDIRVLSLADLDPGVPVLAMADGVVRGIRDGMADKYVNTEVDRESVRDRECGNGLAITHSDGHVSQYCHLKLGSITVKTGDAVAKGQTLGKIGASGLVQFPHVEIEFRQDGTILDIISGRASGQDCDATPVEAVPRLQKAFADALGSGDSVLLSAGLSGRQYVHSELSRSGPPRLATTQDRITIGWAWFANLRKGDRVHIELVWPDGETREEQTTDPLDRNKADYSLFVGKARSPVAGSYELSVRITRNDSPIREFAKTISVE